MIKEKKKAELELMKLMIAIFFCWYEEKEKKKATLSAKMLYSYDDSSSYFLLSCRAIERERE